MATTTATTKPGTASESQATAMQERATQREARPRRTITPRVDIYETDAGFILLADMPGVRLDGLDVLAAGDTLTIRGRPAVRPDHGEPDYQEFELADYYRVFSLTEDLETEKTTAVLRDGVLRVEIPKSAKLKPKKIAVRGE